MKLNIIIGLLALEVILSGVALWKIYKYKQETIKLMNEQENRLNEELTGLKTAIGAANDRVIKKLDELAANNPDLEDEINEVKDMTAQVNQILAGDAPPVEEQPGGSGTGSPEGGGEGNPDAGGSTPEETPASGGGLPEAGGSPEGGSSVEGGGDPQSGGGSFGGTGDPV